MANAPKVDKPVYVLFFTNNCKFCKNLINLLKPKEEFVKKFNIVDIDTIPAIPDEVDEVPCIYDGKSIHKGSAAFAWLNEKLSEYLDSAYDSINYSFLEGQDEKVFGNYSLLEQRNGCSGVGDSPVQAGGDPTRMMSIQDNSNKNATLESIIASRGLDFK
jgi:thiol-disulfide isomerase/thioredoxin